MGGSRWNPHCKMRRDQPHALIGEYFHDAADCVDELIRPMYVFWHLKLGRVFMGERRDRNTGVRIVFCQKFILSQ